MHCGGRGYVGSVAPPTSQPPIPNQKSTFLSHRVKRRFTEEMLMRMVNPLEPRSQAIRRVASAGVDEPKVVATTTESVQTIPPPTERKMEDLSGLLSIGATINTKGRDVCRFCLRPVRMDGGLEKHLLKCKAVTGTPVKPELMNINVARPPAAPRARPSSPPAREKRSVIGARYVPPNAKKKNAVGTRSVTTKASPHSYTTCPYCKASLKAKNFERHVRKAHKRYDTKGWRPDTEHPRTGKAAPQSNGSNGRRVVPRQQSMREAFAEVNSIDVRDKTRGYGFPCRENGRYGSHPMHDGFDDDSGPD